MLSPYEKEKIDADNYGITFGYSLIRNERAFTVLIGLIIAAVTVATLLIIL